MKDNRILIDFEIKIYVLHFRIWFVVFFDKISNFKMYLKIHNNYLIFDK